MKLILDTNIYLSELGLQNPSGSVFRFLLKKSGQCLTVHKVIERELQINLSRTLNKWSHEVRENHRRLLGLLGKLKDIVLPSDGEIGAFALDYIKKLDVECEIVNPQAKDFEQALEMVLNGVPPNGEKNQQFKDSLIWISMVRMLADGDVVFVSGDGAFFERDKPILRQELTDQIKDKPYRLTAFHSLKDYLKSRNADLKIDVSQSLKNVIDYRWPAIQGFLGSKGWEPSGVFQPGVDGVYATEKADEIFVEYSGSLPCREGATTGRLQLSGSYVAKIDRSTIVRHSFGDQILFKTTDSGEIRMGEIIFGSAHGVSGHKDIFWQQRHRIDFEQCR